MFVALGLFLKQCSQVTTLGVRPQFTDYTPSEMKLIREAEAVFFPTWRYVPIFEATDKATFPSSNSYHYKRSIHLQFSLAAYLNIPRLKTRFFAGHRQKSLILTEFSLPVKIFYGAGFRRCYGTVHNRKDFERAISLSHSVLVQEIIDSGDMEVVELIFLNFDFAGWKGPDRIKESHQPIVEKSLYICEQAGIDDISIKWVSCNGIWKFAGMGNPPLYFKSYGGLISRRHTLCEMLRDISTGEAVPPWIKIREPVI